MKPWKCFWGAALLCLFLLASCGEPNEVRTALDTADSLLADGQPDSALSLLEPILPRVPSFPKSQRMRYHLLRTQAQNKCDTVFRSDSVIRTVADYYDRHGTPNDRMLAHYLLGRALSDMGESPEALQAFHDAADCADTTATDCDYATLSRIHTQTAYLLQLQLLPQESIKELKLASDYAKKANEMAVSIRNYEQIASSYYLLDKKDSALMVCKETQDLYIEKGFQQWAYNSTALVFYILTEQHRWKEARICMNEFEANSGLFDENGNIARGRELYYAAKGDFYLGINALDSAEFWYRKSLPFSSDLNILEAASRGLAELYDRKHVADSTMKYARMYCQTNDSTNMRERAGLVMKMQSSHQYTRMKDKAEREALSARDAWKAFATLAMVAFCLLVTLLVILFIWKKTGEEQKKHLLESNRRYSTLLAKYMENQRKRKLLEKNHLTELSKLNKEKEMLNEQLAQFMDSSFLQEKLESETDVLQESVISDLHSCAASASTPSSKMWNDLIILVRERMPSFNQEIRSEKYGLTKEEIVICILIKCRFIPSELCALLGKRSQRMTNMRANINLKLFRQKGAKGLEMSIWKMQE